MGKQTFQTDDDGPHTKGELLHTNIHLLTRWSCEDVRKREMNGRNTPRNYVNLNLWEASEYPFDIRVSERERILKYQVVLSQHRCERFYLFIHFQAIWELFVTGEEWDEIELKRARERRRFVWEKTEKLSGKSYRKNYSNRRWRFMRWQWMLDVVVGLVVSRWDVIAVWRAWLDWWGWWR